MSSGAFVGAQEFGSQIQAVSDAISAELQRQSERLRGQLHQRRLQLLLSLVAHLDSETVHLPFTGPESTEASASALRGREAIELTRSRVQELCQRVAAAMPSVQIVPEVPRVGARCRARWLDGKPYDAEVQRIMDDGTILLNWLRPQPTKEGLNKPLVTVSERGGDDTLHRLVSPEHIQILRSGSVADPPAEVIEAQRFFESRCEEDLRCGDCGEEGADWASVSFGIYLCTTCAAVHRELGPKRSLVRPIDNGWGWPGLDLTPMRLGGNAAFQASLDAYPSVSTGTLVDRYSSRFAEFYRRNLDTLCAGLQSPQQPPQEGAAARTSGEFLTTSEAAAAAQGSGRRFLAAASAALLRLPRTDLLTSRQAPQGGWSQRGMMRAASEALPTTKSLWGADLR